jgi:hypothetical protein
MPKDDDEEYESEIEIEPTPDFVIDEEDGNFTPLSLGQLKCLLRRANRQSDAEILGNIVDDKEFAALCQVFCERYLPQLEFANLVAGERMSTPPREATPQVIVHSWNDFVKPKVATEQGPDKPVDQSAIATISGPSISDFL